MQSNGIASRSLSSLVRTRADNIRAFLQQTVPNISSEQRHLDEGSAERSYWHYGYLSALEDIIKLAAERN